MTYAGKESSWDQSTWKYVKQSNILAWYDTQVGYKDHVTIATYKVSNGWYIIHANQYSYNTTGKAVVEEVIPSFYITRFLPPYVYYWNSIGRGN